MVCPAGFVLAASATHSVVLAASRPVTARDATPTVFPVTGVVIASTSGCSLFADGYRSARYVSRVPGTEPRPSSFCSGRLPAVGDMPRHDDRRPHRMGVDGGSPRCSVSSARRDRTNLRSGDGSQPWSLHCRH